MTRGLSSPHQTAVAAETKWPVHLAVLKFKEATLRVCSTPFTVFFDHDGDGNDEEFTGVGKLGGVSAIEETTEGKVNKVTLALTGVDQAYIAIALGYEYRFRPATVYRAYYNDDWEMIDSPRVRFKGLMSKMPVSIGDQAAQQAAKAMGSESTLATIRVEIVSRMARWDRPVNTPRWSDGDHQARRPGDTFFSRMGEIAAGKEVVWKG